MTKYSKFAQLCLKRSQSGCPPSIAYIKGHEHSGFFLDTYRSIHDNVGGIGVFIFSYIKFKQDGSVSLQVGPNYRLNGRAARLTAFQTYANFEYFVIKLNENYFILFMAPCKILFYTFRDACQSIDAFCFFECNFFIL